ncbi:MAG: tetratricopeptide repeat protein [Nannocystaceae bacterium]
MQVKRVQAQPQATAEAVRLVHLAHATGQSNQLYAIFESLEQLAPARSLGLGLLAYEAFLVSGTQADFVRAESQIRSALAVASDDPYALAGAILLYLARGATTPSYLELVRKLCDQNRPPSAEVLTACAQVSFAVGNPTRGNDRYRDAVEHDPELFPAWLLWGKQALAAGRIEQAAHHFEQASATPLPSLQYAAFLGLGAAKFLQRDFQAAAQAYNAAANARAHGKKIVPTSMPAALQYNLGLVLAQQPGKEVQNSAIEWLSAYLDNSDALPERRLRARQIVERLRRRWHPGQKPSP